MFRFGGTDDDYDKMKIKSKTPSTNKKKKGGGHHTSKSQSSGQFYFVQKDPGSSDSVRDCDDIVETIELNFNTSAGGTNNTNGAELYEPKAVNRNLVKGMSLMKNESTREGSVTSSSLKHHQGSKNNVPRTTMNPLSRVLVVIFGNPSKRDKHKRNDEDVKKVNQKLFLGNERTFLKWMNVSVWTTGAAIGLSAVAPSSSTVTTNAGMYGGNFEAYSSLLFLGISIVICTYAMVQFAKRTLLIVKRSPSGYEDRYGPIIIGAMFVLAFTAQYCIMMAQFTR